MAERKIDKGDLVIADRILDKIFTTISQWERDVNRAMHELELIETDIDIDGLYYIPTQKYIDAYDKIYLSNI